MFRPLIIAAVLATMATPSSAADPLPIPSGNGRSWVPGACAAEILPVLPAANLGECVGYSNTSEAGFASHDCDAFMEIEPDLFFAIYDSYSDCVRQNKAHPAN